MKKVFKWIGGLILVVLILLAAGILYRDQVIKTVIIKRARARSGMELEIDMLRLRLNPPGIDIRGMRVPNPPGFGEGMIFDIPELKINWLWKPLRRRELHITGIDLNMRAFNIVINRDGELNTGAFRTAHPKKDEKKKPDPIAVRVDRLRLKIARAGFKDMRTEQDEVYYLDIDQEFKDLKTRWHLEEVLLVVLNAIENNPRHSTGLDMTLLGRRASPESMEGLPGELRKVGADLAGIIENII